MHPRISIRGLSVGQSIILSLFQWKANQSMSCIIQSCNHPINHEDASLVLLALFVVQSATLFCRAVSCSPTAVDISVHFRKPQASACALGKYCDYVQEHLLTVTVDLPRSDVPEVANDVEIWCPLRKFFKPSCDGRERDDHQVRAVNLNNK